MKKSFTVSGLVDSGTIQDKPNASIFLNPYRCIHNLMEFFKELLLLRSPVMADMGSRADEARNHRC